MIKITTGYRDDQYVIIDNEDAHKAQYLFLHPEERAIFANGVALVGKLIQGIDPAWNQIMGWNPTHKLEDDDWNDIRGKGIDRKMQQLLSDAKEIAYLAEKNPELLNKPLSEAKLLLDNPQRKEISEATKQLSNKFRLS